MLPLRTAIKPGPRSYNARNHRRFSPPGARVSGSGREGSPATRLRGVLFKSIEQRVTDEQVALFPADLTLIDRILKRAHVLPNRDLTVSWSVARGLKTDDVHGTPPLRDIVGDLSVVKQAPLLSL
jgi:hypothetical protein